MPKTIAKTGQGAFHLRISDDGSVIVVKDGGPTNRFANAAMAREHYLQFAQDDHAAWNICYHLEDFIPELT